jgi:hypothetical protein
MKKRDFLFIIPSFVFLVFLISAPLAAHAASFSFPTQIFPQVCNCPGSAPAWGCIMQTFQNVIQFVIAFAVILITIFLAWAGFTYMTSGGNPGKHELANKRIMNAVIGLLIVLCAYLLVDSILKVIYNPANPAFGPWNSILGGNPGPDCLRTVNPPALPSVGNPAATTPAASPTTPAGAGHSGLNVSAAVAFLQANARPLNQYGGYCAVAIRNALNAGGLTQFSSGQGNAYQYGPALTNAGFTQIYSGTYSSASASAMAWQAGDVAVFQPVNGHPNGHVTMYTGSQWISDAIQAQMASNNADYQGGSFTVYSP